MTTQNPISSRFSCCFANGEALARAARPLLAAVAIAAVVPAFAQERSAPADTSAARARTSTLRERIAADPAGVVAAAESTNEITGIAERWIFDSEDPAAAPRRVSRILTAEGPVEIFGDAAASLEPGFDVTLSGVRAGDRMAAVKAARKGGPAPTITCPATGEQKTAVLLAYDASTTPPTASPQAIGDALFGASRSADQFWREASYGRAWTTGSVFGWRKLSKTYDFCTEYSTMFTDALKAFGTELRGGGYTRFYLVSPRRYACGWAGLSSVGCTALSNTVNGSVSYLALDYAASSLAVPLFTHEGGHQLGLDHSSTLAFGSAPLVDPNTYGTVDEYGDPFSTMGMWNLGQYPAPMKAKLGWLSPTSNYLDIASNGTYTLQPIEQGPAGLQALRIRRGSAGDSWLWVEYRQPVGGYDTTVATAAWSGAIVHYERWEETRSLLVDFTPSTGSWSDAALAAGQSWSDPYSNLTLRVNAASASGLALTVEYR